MQVLRHYRIRCRDHVVELGAQDPRRGGRRALGERHAVPRGGVAAVVVTDQETLALGGLIQEDATNNNTGVPYLQKVPVLGGLFSYQGRSAVRRELFIIIHPQIIRGGGNNSAQMQAFRSSFTNVSALLREAGL